VIFETIGTSGRLSIRPRTSLTKDSISGAVLAAENDWLIPRMESLLESASTCRPTDNTS